MFYEGKTALVTGGSGFVGTHIVNELLAQGARVRVPIHKSPLNINDERVETFPADLSKPEECEAAVKGVDYIFHAAGTVGSAAVTPAEVMSGIATNLILTLRMLEAAWQQNTERFLLLSSSTVYPAADYPVTEEEAWSGPTHTSYLGYGWMKRYLEKLAEFAISQSDLLVAVVRPTAVYGRWDTSHHVVPALIQKAVGLEDPFQVWGSGEEVRDFLHVSDLARGCLLALEKHAVCDPVNLGYGQGFTVKEIVHIILEAAGHQPDKIEFDTTKPTNIPFRMVDTSLARTVLSFEPQITLQEGLRDTVEWYTRGDANREK
jgi:GDP-L-fucose synthase